MIPMRHRPFWVLISALALFSVLAGILVLRPHRLAADPCCKTPGAKAALQGKDCPMQGSWKGKLPPGHPDIQQLTKAGPLTDDQLASGAKSGCPYLARQAKTATKS